MIIIVILLFVYSLQSSYGSPLCHRTPQYAFYKAEAAHSPYYGQQPCSTYVDDNDLVRILLWGLHTNSPLVGSIGTERVLDLVSQQLNRSTIEISELIPKPDTEFVIRATSHQNLAQAIKWYMSSQPQAQNVQYVIHAKGENYHVTNGETESLEIEFRKYINKKRKQEEIARLENESL